MPLVTLGKLIGGGIATISTAGSGLGIGAVFAALILGVSRNPSTKQRLFVYATLGFALPEAVTLFGLMMAFLTLPAFVLTPLAGAFAGVELSCPGVPTSVISPQLYDLCGSAAMVVPVFIVASLVMVVIPALVRELRNQRTSLRPVRALDVAGLVTLLGDAVSPATILTCFLYTAIFAGVWALAFWLAGKWPGTRAFWLYTPFFGCMDTFLDYNVPEVVAIAISFALFHLFVPKELPPLGARVDQVFGPDFRRALDADDLIIDAFREKYTPEQFTRIAAYGLTPALFVYVTGGVFKALGLGVMSLAAFAITSLTGLLHVYLGLLHFFAIAWCPAPHTTRWFESRQSRSNEKPGAKQGGSPRGFRSTTPARMPVGPVKKFLLQSKAALAAKATQVTKASAQQLALKGVKLFVGAGSAAVGVDTINVALYPEDSKYTMTSIASGWAQKGVPQTRIEMGQQVQSALHDFSGRTDEGSFPKTEAYVK